MFSGFEAIGAPGCRKLVVDGTDNKAAIVPDQRRINRIPFSPAPSEWPPVSLGATISRFLAPTSGTC